MKLILKLALMLLFTSIVNPLISNADEVNLPKTGQTTCYDSSGYIINCTGTGQDGEVQAGATWPSPRFEDNGNGTITDHLTGLVWLKNANCFGGMNWSDALDACNNLHSGNCGLTDGSVAGDWRLPNVIELESLVNLGSSGVYSWLNSQGFIDVQSATYWSGTTYASDPQYAWAAYYLYGLIVGNYKNYECFVWPVRDY